MSLQSPHIRRSAGTPLAVALAAVLVTALSGCSGLLPAREKTLPSAQLKKELLTAPIGSKPYDRGTFSSNGILSLDQFVDGDFVAKDRSSEHANLADDDFRYATQTNWEGVGGSSAEIFAIQFGRTAGAEDFVASISEATSQEQEPNRPMFSLPGVPGGEGWSAGAVDGIGDIWQSAWFSVGNVAVDLHYYTPAKADRAGLEKLARAQRARLVSKVTAPSPVPASSALATPSAAPVPAAATAAAKKQLLADLMAAPHGSRPWSTAKGNGPVGILTLDQLLVRLADTAADRRQITAEEQDRGFLYAARKNWFGADSVQADVTLLRFSSATGAQSYTLGYQSGAGNAVGSKGTYRIPGSGDATAYEHSGLDHDGYIWTEVYAVAGDVAVDMTVWVPAKARRSEVTALVKKQFAKLMADPAVAAADRAAPALPTPDS